ncbi:ABC transporter permease subunit [Amycolatopsis sp.]|uniref:ABC transporter permease subunit n=1 Tax=Amycolatopsis sp. TaxID=37632 RepID=UPI002C169284|nr:ABC transporter permease subunit [Amycolatopsis sp.]HVV08678.1 ABC transporter permease subunit [Amycolatopsis sp.]
MTWLTWRQFRTSALSVFSGLAVIGVVLGITGPQLAGRTDFSDQDFLYNGTILLVYVLPAIIGVFWGVPLVTRELENGTHSLVWNQTITRKRWLGTKLGAGVLTAMIAAGLLSLAVTWWAGPIDALAAQSTDRSMVSRMSPVVFAARGIVPIGYAAFAFVLGVAVGIVLRRTVTAMAVTLVLFVGVQLAVPLLVRPYLLPAVNETVAITASNVLGISGDNQGVIQNIVVQEPAGAWMLTDETVDPSGKAVSPLPDVVQNCAPKPGQGGLPEPGSAATCIAKLNDLGYHQQLAYQPASRFWALQWIELGLFLVLSAFVGWFSFRRLRHLA